ncbi:MAG TPA: AraC family transcriptional regulator [Verrucomicrobiae bacterium]|nr:AraC family transcriptional regulator [Verrucomicrobiae bacterium]
MRAMNRRTVRRVFRPIAQPGGPPRAGIRAPHRHGAVYRESGHAYAADACEPLARAEREGAVRLRALARFQYPGRRLPAGQLRGVCSIGYWDAPAPQGWGLGWHRNEGLELAFLESGRIAFAVEGHRPEILRPGALTITRPWQPHRVGEPHVGAGRLHWLILDVGVRHPNQPWRWPPWIVLTREDLAELTRLLRQQEIPVWAGGTDIRQCFEGIARAIDTATTPPCSRLSVLINELLVLLLELLRRHSPRLDESLTSSERAVEIFLNELARDPSLLARPWSVPDLARQCGLGATAFTQYCRELTNATPLAHLNRLRLDHAARLLRERADAPIKQIAAQCGFATGQYFATAYRRQFGRSPRREPPHARRQPHA